VFILHRRYLRRKIGPKRIAFHFLEIHSLRMPMMSTDSPEFKAASDEAWKDHVRAENAELEKTAAAIPGETPSAGESMKLPAADLPALVEILTTQSLVALGMIPHPASGKGGPQLPLARHFIDLLGILEAKTAGNLSADETSLLGGTLHYLRMSYIEISKRSPNPKK
jgi:Domain of unknown function (DUF1844)